SEAIVALVKLSSDQLDEIISVQSQAYLAKLDNEEQFESDQYRRLCLTIIGAKDTDLTKHWVMDIDYLKSNNKDPAIELLKQSGFADAYDKKEGEGSFSKLKKVSEIHGAVKKFSFDFTGFLPEPADYKNYLK
ncbi:hypothetical protein LCGC14_2634630, partial [marine sediment metagenome]